MKPEEIGRALAPFGIALVGLLMVSMIFAMDNATYDVWAGFWVGPVLMLIAARITRRAGERENKPSLGRFLFWAAFLKIIVGSTTRAMMVYWMYKGDGDAERYFTNGIEFTDEFRRLDFTRVGKISGTQSIEYLTGVVTALIGNTRLGGFMVYSFVGFLGIYWFYRAFRIALPDADERRYRLLLFLAPTIWFWPSSIGKDAIMVGALGLASLGAARLLRGEMKGLTPLLLGGASTMIVRPHLTLILAVGVAAGFAVRTLRSHDSSQEASGKRGRVFLVAIPLAMIGLGVVVPRFEEFFKIEELNTGSADALFEEVDRRTSKGGAEFSLPDPRSPVGFVAVVLSIMFRPMPFEVDNIAAGVASIENVVYLYLFIRWRRSLLHSARQLLSNSWVAFSVGYAMVFCYAFASIENFAILARQRAQLFPVIFVLVCVGEAKRRGRPSPRGPVKAPERATGS